MHTSMFFTQDDTYWMSGKSSCWTF